LLTLPNDYDKKIYLTLLIINPRFLSPKIQD